MIEIIYIIIIKITIDSQLMATELQMQAIQERYNLDVQGVRNDNAALTTRINEYEDAVKAVCIGGMTE